MELLELTPPDFAVEYAGIYVVVDDGIRILAGPFAHETAALIWIEQTRAVRSAQGYDEQKNRQHYAPR